MKRLREKVKARTGRNRVGVRDIRAVIVVSRSGTDLPAGAADLIWGPDDIVRAWSG
jgi:hypothetical protein